uniref:Ras-related protein Rab n=1 Tax=Strigamia maritima TaxID=126957 RepID=T1IMU1_STRMM
MNNNLVYKVIVIGNASVGKTAFVRSYIFDNPHLENSATVGVEFMVKTIELPDKSTVKLQVWDIGGQDRSAFLMRSFCHRAHGCVLLFDVTNPPSFECVCHWKRAVEEKCLQEGRKPIPCILLANKCDLNERHVKFMDIDKLTNELGFICWKEISVKEKLNIEEAMMSLLQAMVTRTTNNLDYESQEEEYIRPGKSLSESKNADDDAIKWQ